MKHSSPVQTTATILMALAAILITPALGAQIKANGGFVAQPAPETIQQQTEPNDPTPRPVATSKPSMGKIPPFGNLMIVYFEEPALARYMGDIPGLEATSPVARGQRKLDPKSAASRAYLQFLEQRQDDYLLQIEQKLGRNVQPIYRYKAADNGIAVKMNRAEGKQIEGIPGVLRVIPDSVAYLQTDRGPTWIGATTIWDGSSTGTLPGTKGEGQIMGSIDSGINMDHPSFAETGGDGYSHTNPNGSGVFVGWCDPTNPNYDPSYPCNDKLIGGWDYTDAYCAANPGICSETDGPEDDNGHGSHTASTSAGNVLLSPAISGVAPHANVIAYDACYTNAQGQGLCPFTSTSAAADQALLDGVDAINYSIGGGDSPWAGDIDTFFLELVGAGAFVAASAGNDGAGTVGHLGPWVATSGASTHDRDIVANELIDLSGGISPPADLSGASRTTGYGPDTIVYAGDFSNGDINPDQCLNPFPGGTWTAGEIVLCDRGDIARVLKCANVAAGGAAGCVLANTPTTNTPPVADAHVIPAIHVDLANGNTLRAWLATGSGHMATITDSVIEVDPALADIMASFSSTGPNTSFSVMKPDVTNPGVDIFAAWLTDGELPSPEFATIGGTSMSSPHTAGSGALLSALYPSWSPSQIKSAIMMTADTTVLKSNGSTPADVTDFGAGRVDLTKAALVGLTLDETYENYVAADPAFGGRPHLLNLPSLQQNDCVGTCTWSRTFASTATTADGGTGTNWTVTFTTPLGISMTATPSNFDVPGGTSQAVEFEIDASTARVGDWVYAKALLTPSDGSPTLHVPVAVQLAEDNFPTDFNILTFDPTGSQPLEGLQYFEAITELTLVDFGFAEGNGTDVVLFEDPTNGDPYDNLGDVFTKTLNVPGGAKRLVVRTASDEAPDVDLFVGTGNTPSAATQQCASTTATATESCEIDNPSNGTWWILVQNWAGSANQPDAIDLLDGVVPGSGNGSLIPSGPTSVAAGIPFDIQVGWNLTTSNAEAGPPPSRFWFGAFSVAKDGVSPAIETIYVNLEVAPDLVFYDGLEDGTTDAWSSTQE